MATRLVSSSSTITITSTTAPPPAAQLRITTPIEAEAEKPHVRWDETGVDNELMNKKKSKSKLLKILTILYFYCVVVFEISDLFFGVFVVLFFSQSAVYFISRNGGTRVAVRVKTRRNHIGMERKRRSLTAVIADVTVNHFIFFMRFLSSEYSVLYIRCRWDTKCAGSRLIES